MIYRIKKLNDLEQFRMEWNGMGRMTCPNMGLVIAFWYLLDPIGYDVFDPELGFV